MDFAELLTVIAGNHLAVCRLSPSCKAQGTFGFGRVRKIIEVRTYIHLYYHPMIDGFPCPYSTKFLQRIAPRRRYMPWFERETCAFNCS